MQSGDWAESARVTIGDWASWMAKITSTRVKPAAEVIANSDGE